MDVLRRELNEIYASQRLDEEFLDRDCVERSVSQMRSCVAIDNDCRVITDASADMCWIFSGVFGRLIGVDKDFEIQSSSDEDAIYTRMHPVDLVDKRMFEYEFFKFVDSLPADEKLHFKATCRIRIRNREGKYIAVCNSTQVLRLAPSGKFWLILCRYDLAPNQNMTDEISPRIVNFHTGEVVEIRLTEKRKHILTDREREVLWLIREGKLSKQIASLLGISVHTVNRHRQNILEKLSVGNSHEAIIAATAMELM